MARFSAQRAYRTGTDSSRAVYRFLYADFERVRSIAATLLGGIPGELNLGSEETVVADASALPVGDPPTGTVKRSRSESRTPHHAIFHTVVSELQASGLLVTPDGSGPLPIEKFLRFSGEVLIRDYAAISASLEALAHLAMAATELGANRPTSVGSRSADLRKARLMKEQVAPLRRTIETMFGDSVRLYAEAGSRRFLGLLERDALVERPSPGLVAETVGGRWDLLCEPLFGEARAINFSEGMSEIESSLEQLVTLLGGIASTVRPTEATLVQPIAVYRVLRPL